MRSDKHLILLLIGIMFVFGCVSSHKSNNENDFFYRMKKLERAYLEFKSPSEYRKYADGDIRDLLGDIYSVRVLENIFRKCSEKSKTHEDNQQRLQFENPYSLALPLVIFRLASMDTIDSCKVLVELYMSRDFEWDGGLSLIALEAIISCRERTEPILKERYSQNKDKQHKIRYILEQIEQVKKGM